jgi:hypothetical protein
MGNTYGDLNAPSWGVLESPNCPCLELVGGGMLGVQS